MIPRSSARWITPVDAASSPAPYTPDMDMHPRPTADTFTALRPSVRSCMIPPPVVDCPAFYYAAGTGPPGAPRAVAME